MEIDFEILDVEIIARSSAMTVEDYGGRIVTAMLDCDREPHSPSPHAHLLGFDMFACFL